MGKIDFAAAATDRVLDMIGKARAMLDMFEGRILNGHGVFSDPSQLRSALGQATKSLSEASEVMTATSWPTRQDYEEAA